STAWVCPLRLMISGAMYSTVPQNEKHFSLFSDSLLRPKSVKLMWPDESSRMFSGLRDGGRVKWARIQPEASHLEVAVDDAQRVEVGERQCQLGQVELDILLGEHDL